MAAAPPKNVCSLSPAGSVRAFQSTVGSGKDYGESFDDLNLVVLSVQIYDRVIPRLTLSQFTLSRRDVQVDVAAKHGKKKKCKLWEDRIKR